MSNCKNLKIKLDRTLVCKLTGKKINWDLCKNCKLRELKINNMQVVHKSPGFKKSNKIQINPNKSKKKKDISSKTRKIVNERDNHTCRLCGKPSVHLHHIIYRSQDKSLIDEPNNLICLCLECHQLVHSNKKKYQPILMSLVNDQKNL